MRSGKMTAGVRSGLSVGSVVDMSAAAEDMLIECVDLNDVRNKYFVVSSMKDLFENVASQNIVDFIKETHFYKQL